MTINRQHCAYLIYSWKLADFSYQYNTRQKIIFYTYVVNTESGKRSVTFKRSNLWNKVPIDIEKNQVILIFQIYT